MEDRSSLESEARKAAAAALSASPAGAAPAFAVGVDDIVVEVVGR